MLTALLLTPAAHSTSLAPADPACTPVVFAASQPRDGAAQVPLDVSPVLLFDGDCTSPFPLEVTVFRGDRRDPERTDVYGPEHSFGAGAMLGIELDVGPLEPDTEYRLEATAGFVDPIVVVFETGSAVLAVPDGSPSVTVDAAFGSRSRDGRRISVELTVTSAWSDPASAELSTWLVREGGLGRGLFVAPAPGEPVEVSWAPVDRLDEVCITVEERDSAGRFSGASAEECSEVTGARGCSVTRPPALLGLLALIPFPFFRRRD